MSPLGIFRKVGKLIRGGAGPVAVFLSCLLGVMLGMAPGFSAWGLLLILLIVFLNVNGFLAGLGALLGKALCLLLAPVTFQIGSFLLYKAGLGGAIAAASETPVLALMDLHVYCLLGGLPVAIVVGSIMGVIFAKLTRAARLRISALVQANKPVDQIGQKKGTRFLMWLMFGKQKEALAEMGKKPQRIIRLGRMIPALVLLALLIGADVLFADSLLRSAIEDNLSQAVGAEVDVRTAHLSILGAKVEIEGLQITDPGKPTHNLVQIDRLASDLSIPALLAKRVVINELTLTGTALDQPRATPGKVLPGPVAVSMPATGPGAAPPGTDPVAEYFEKAQELRKYEDQLKQVQDWLRKNRAKDAKQSVSEEEARDLADEARRLGYLVLSAKELIAKHPDVIIRKLAVDSIRTPSSAAVFSLRGANISNAPSKDPEDMSIEITSNQGFLAKLVLRYSAPGLAHQFALRVPDIDLKKWQLSDKAPIRAEQGTADVEAAGEFDATSINLPVKIVTHNMKLATRPGRGMLGQDAATSAKWTDYLSNMTFAVALRGPLSSPHLVIDDKAMLTAIQDSLAKAGQKMLADQAGQAAQKALGNLGGDIGKTLTGGGGDLGKTLTGGDANKGLPGGLGNILGGGNKPTPSSQPTGTGSPSPSPKRGPLDGLLPK